MQKIIMAMAVCGVVVLFQNCAGVNFDTADIEAASVELPEIDLGYIGPISDSQSTEVPVSGAPQPVTPPSNPVTPTPEANVPSVGSGESVAGGGEAEQPRCPSEVIVLVGHGYPYLNQQHGCFGGQLYAEKYIRACYGSDTLVWSGCY